MAKDGVPLFMGEDEAEHSAEILRTLIWAIFRGQEGFLTSTAGKTRALLTPGAGVRLLPGPFVVNSRFPGGQLQSYMTKIINDEIVDATAVPPGYPGGFRYDLVVCNIEDPTPSGGAQWPLPSTSDARRTGPYWNVRIVEGVPANCVTLEQIPANHPQGARGWTGLVSSRIKRPANSSIITDDMITPLTPVMNVLGGISLPPDISGNLPDAISELQSVVGGIAAGRIPIPNEYVDSIDCTNPANSSDNSNRLYYTETNYKIWPKEAQWTDIYIPTYATHAELFIAITNPYQKATAVNQDAHVWGDLIFQLEYGTTTAQSTPEKFDADEINSSDNRAPSAGSTTTPTPGTRPGNRPHLFLSGPMAIPAALRGKRCIGKVFARMFADSTVRGQLIADASTSVRLQINFKEKP